MDPLIGVEELAARLDEVVLLDVRWSLGGPPGRSQYGAGHIPGAAFVDLDADLAAPPDEHGRHPLPAPAAFEAAMRRVGVDDDRPTVCYDQRDGSAAARAWWLLRYHGHRDTRVLDGGYDGWLAAGRPTSTDVPPRGPGGFTARPAHLRLLDARDAEDLARVGVLLDARSTERYAGIDEPVDPVAGHIPGAVSAPTAANVDAAGRFLEPVRLRERFEALGVTSGRPVGAYCGSGITAAHEVLALERAGFEAALYADSWSGWITDPARPVARGETPG